METCMTFWPALKIRTLHTIICFLRSSSSWACQSSDPKSISSGKQIYLKTRLGGGRNPLKRQCASPSPEPVPCCSCLQNFCQAERTTKPHYLSELQLKEENFPFSFYFFFQYQPKDKACFSWLPPPWPPPGFLTVSLKPLPFGTQLLASWGLLLSLLSLMNPNLKGTVSLSSSYPSLCPSSCLHGL